LLKVKTLKTKRISTIENVPDNCEGSDTLFREHMLFSDGYAWLGYTKTDKNLWGIHAGVKLGEKSICQLKSWMQKNSSK